MGISHTTVTEFKGRAAVDTFILRALLLPDPDREGYPCSCKAYGDIHESHHGPVEPGGRAICLNCGTIIKPWEFPNGHCKPIRKPQIKEFA